ncbi:MAG: tyrosine-type recombinase/integrase [Dehalococcoidia bacterium]
MDGFALTYKLNGMSPLTIEHHQHKLLRFAQYLDDQQLTHIDTAVIRGFLGHVRDTYSLSPLTVERYLVALKAFWRWAIEEGYADSNPTTKVRLARPPQKLVRGLSPEQTKVLLNALADEKPRDKAIVLILLDTGIRVSELVNVKIEDVDMQRGVIRIMGKGSKERLVRMGLKTQKALWRYLALRKNDSPWLWINQYGGRLLSNGVQQMMRKLGRRIGVPELHPHLLRHTFAISFLRNGANTFECQYTLGHSTLEMTRRYTQALNFEDVFKRHQTASPVDNIR